MTRKRIDETATLAKVVGLVEKKTLGGARDYLTRYESPVDKYLGLTKHLGGP